MFEVGGERIVALVEWDELVWRETRRSETGAMRWQALVDDWLELSLVDGVDGLGVVIYAS